MVELLYLVEFFSYDHHVIDTRNNETAVEIGKLPALCPFRHHVVMVKLVNSQELL